MVKTAEKDLKIIAQQAKNRLKHRFWKEYQETVTKNLAVAQQQGVNTSKVIKYYKTKVLNDISGKDDDNVFYQKVKNILDTYGYVSNVIGMLCDEQYMKTLCFQQKQKYVLDISNKYLICLEKYEQEKKYELVKYKNVANG